MHGVLNILENPIYFMVGGFHSPGLFVSEMTKIETGFY